MIRINLLPQEDRHVRRKLKLPRVSATVPYVAAALVLAMTVVATSLQEIRERRLRNEIEATREEVRKLQPAIDKIDRLTEEREALNRRLAVIRELDRERFVRVRMLDDLSREVPKHMWLTSLAEADSAHLSISGVTFSNLIVADLMTRLDRQPLFEGVDLLSTEKGLIDERDVVKFQITSRMHPGAVSEDGGPAAGGEE
jgi:type IV pilus assembly protein PilN